jgi:hypothetical protein
LQPGPTTERRTHDLATATALVTSGRASSTRHGSPRDCSSSSTLAPSSTQGLERYRVETSALQLHFNENEAFRLYSTNAAYSPLAPSSSAYRYSRADIDTIVSFAVSRSPQ